MRRPPSDDYLRREIERLEQQRDAIERELYVLRGILDGRQRLRERDQGGNTNESMVAAERLRVSRGKRDSTPLRDAVNAANLTMRSLAEQLKAEGFEATHSLLSQAHTGKRSISERLARRVEALTGFAASKRNWPRIRIGE